MKKEKGRIFMINSKNIMCVLIDDELGVPIEFNLR